MRLQEFLSRLSSIKGNNKRKELLELLLWIFKTFINNQVKFNHNCYRTLSIKIKKDSEELRLYTKSSPNWVVRLQKFFTKWYSSIRKIQKVELLEILLWIFRTSKNNQVKFNCYRISPLKIEEDAMTNQVKLNRNRYKTLSIKIKEDSKELRLFTKSSLNWVVRLQEFPTKWYSSIRKIQR